MTKKLTKKTRVKVGAQNCHYSQNPGPFTGSINTDLIKLSGARYVIIGHSENRMSGDTNQIINLNWNANSLEIPHPRLQDRNFVLLPLFEISKNWKPPKLNLKITDLLAKIGINNLRSIKLS